MLLLVLGKALGIFPINGQFKLSIPLLVYSVGLVTVTGFLFVENVSSRESAFLTKSLLDKSSTVLRVSIWLSHLRALCNGDTLLLDPLRNRKFSIESIVTVLICLGFPIYEGVVLYEWFGGMSYSRCITGGMTRIIQYLILFQFIECVDQLSKHFDRRIFSNITDSIAFQKSVLKKARKLNELYKIQLLSGTVSIFISLCSESYYVINDLLSSVNRPRVSILQGEMDVQQILSFFLAFYWLLRLVSSCETFHLKVKTFNDGIYRAAKNDKYLWCNEQWQLSVIERPSVVYTAFRFYPISYPLITYMIGAAFTYLVVLLEFPSDV